MSKQIRIRKGLDINLKGKAEKIFSSADPAETYAVKPTDFPGLTPKLAVKVDDTVQAGSPLFFDKYNPDTKFTSPVSGKVQAINRGERRKVLEVVIKPDTETSYQKFEVSDAMSKDDIIKTLKDSGCWPYIKQRPFNVIANSEQTPKAIFISTFDTAPLAADLDFALKGNESSFQKGIDILKKLTPGEIHLGINGKYPAPPIFENAKGATKNYFQGPHPAGNVGIQIHHIDPINKGEVAWTLGAQDVVIIGRLFEKGVYDATKAIALAGSEVVTPRYYKVISGCSIENIVDKNVTDSHKRYISGNVLTGEQVNKDGYLGFYSNQISVIPEGDHYEFMGWAGPGFGKFSNSRAFWSWLSPKKEFALHTNLNGGHRAFVVTGQYEKVLPMDIYPVQLLKSILVEDIEMMEKLGMYEIAEEDLALCEFVCTSKTDVQAIVRKGIDLMIKELS